MLKHIVHYPIRIPMSAVAFLNFLGSQITGTVSYQYKFLILVIRQLNIPWLSFKNRKQ